MKCNFVYITKQSSMAKTKQPDIISLCEAMISLFAKRVAVAELAKGVYQRTLTFFVRGSITV